MRNFRLGFFADRIVAAVRAGFIGGLAASAIFAAFSVPAAAQTYLPSVKIGTAALIDPSAADSNFYGAGTTSTNDLGGSVRPPEIVALARALKNDPDLIYQYVHNNIDMVWEYGLQKGSLGTSIDRAGTPFDQAMLMVELLRQAGYGATYEVGTITLTGSQFAAWTNITSATAACQLLSGGGIPARVNGSATANCSYGGATVSTVELAHAWVKVAIAGSTCGTNCLFDPSYKPYNWLAGLDLSGATTGFSTGAALAAAGSGMDTGSAFSLPYVHNLNQGGLSSLLQSYSSTLLAYLRNNAMSGAQIEDIVGGGVILPAGTTALRQSALPYSTTLQHEWSGSVPNQYRTTLYVKGEMRNIRTGIIDTMFERTFYVDEIYGRKLSIGTNFNTSEITSSGQFETYAAYLKLDDHMLGTQYQMAARPNQHDPVALTLTANHPYAAAADGSSTTNGQYMDATIYKSAILVNPVSIVMGFGDTSPDLLSKWTSERAFDLADPMKLNPPSCPNECPDPSPYLSAAGDFNHEKMQASFLAQFTRAAHLHAALAGGYASGPHGGIVQIHHVIGVVYGDDLVDDDGWTQGAYQEPNFWVADSYTRLDVDTGMSFVSKTADAAARRGAILAIAATGAALEGSVAAQMNDMPDTSSTATRFEWGNGPTCLVPGSLGHCEDPTGAGPRKFFQYGAGQSVPAGWVLWENQANPPTTGSISDGYPQSWAPDEMNALKNDINAYSAAGFVVTASQESFLGPGQRGGYVKMNGHTGSPANTKQRGGAIVATKFDANGDPLEIAHDVVGLIATDSYGVVRPAKGGGGGVQPSIAASYSPADPADILKSRFVDRSNALGVNLANGSISYQSPATLSLGTGGSPFELSASYSWHPGAGASDFGPQQVPPTGWVSNWYNSLSISGSGLEGMGVSDVRAAVGTIAAFLAAQDIYANTTPSAQRDVAAVLTQSWLMRQFVGNVVTVNFGGSTRQFVRLADGNWIAPGASYATLTQTGTRAPFSMVCGLDQFAPRFALTRGWDNSGLSFTVTGAGGDQQHYGYWMWHDTGSNQGPSGFCSRTTGFRLNSWNFANGVVINLTYANDTLEADGQSRSDSPNALVGYPSSTTLASVTNSLGRTLTFGTNLTTMQPTVTDGSRTLLGPGPYGSTTTTDPAGNVTTFSLVDFTPSATQRPAFTQLSQVFTADNPSAPNIEYDYDGIGRVYQVKDAINLQTGGRNPTTFYIADGTRSERDDPLGGAYTVVYDTYHNPYRYIDEDGRETDTQLDGRGRPRFYNYPEHDEEDFLYDERNNAIQMTRAPKPGSLLPNIVLQVAYTDGPTVEICPLGDIATCNKPVTQTNARGFVTNLTWDSVTGLLTKVQLPAPVAGGNRPETDYAYTSYGADGFKLLTNIVVATGASTGATASMTTIYAYNPSNFYVPQSATVDSGGQALTTSYTFDSIGNPLDVDGPRTDVADATDFTWDANRKQVFGILPDPDGAGPHPRPAYKSTYDVVGRVTALDTGSVTSASGGGWVPSGDTLATVYDPDGNKIKDSTGTRLTQYSYDGANRVLCTAVRMNRDASGTFGTLPSDACALSTATTYGPDRIVKTVYDPAGQVLQEIRAYGTSIQETYATNTYTPNGKLASVYDADGTSHVTNYIYDGFDRVATTTFGDGTSEQLTYLVGTTLCSSNGQPCTKTNRSGQVFTLTYDPLDRLTNKVVPASGSIPSNTVTSTYDLQSRVTAITDTYGNTISKTYDSVNHLISTTRTTPLLTARTVSYQYDAAGNRTRLTWPDGYYANYYYDALNHPTTVTDSDGTTLATYAYDDLARRASLQYAGTAGAKMLYSWSAENDLLTLQSDLAGSANDVSYTHTFSPAHQWATATITNFANRYTPLASNTVAYGPVNSVNEYSTVGGLGQGYDLRGNLTSDGVRTYTYDAENRLIMASAGNIYAYDPLGRRTTKTVNSVVTSFLHDGDNEIAEYDGSGNLLRRFVPGPAIDDYVAMVTAAGTKTYFHTDKMGSITAMSDASGAIVPDGPYTYDAYGNCSANGAACSGGVPFRYTGQRLDPETGLYYYRARYYSPAQGRFLQTDPVGYKDDLDLYTYVHNDPTDLTDPMGLYGMDDPRWDASAAAIMKMSTPEKERLAEVAITIATIPLGGEGLEFEITARVFWSGGEAARVAATEYALATGGKTLGMSLRGKIVAWLAKRFGDKNVGWLWKLVSKSWAKGAQDEVHVFLGKVNPEGIWTTIEEKILTKNGVKIIEHDIAPKAGDAAKAARNANRAGHGGGPGCPAPRPGLSCGGDAEWWN